jgi:D-alanine-D-alanine ligase
MDIDRKKKSSVAVFLGGKSPEHDVSIVTGLQVASAINQNKYDVTLVYISTDGEWWTGDALWKRESYLLGSTEKNQLTEIRLDFSHQDRPNLITKRSHLLQRQKNIMFDVAIPAFHGTLGEDGGFQGLLDVADVPYTGMRTLASAVLMDKVLTKRMLQGTNIPLLPYRTICRPIEGLIVPTGQLESEIGDFKFPCCVKPVHLGSSIGVAKVNNISELQAALPIIFEFDTAALLEPFVENMVEYNVAVSRAFGPLMTSAIEKPKRVEDLLSFKEKYMSDGGKKVGRKSLGQTSEGLLSLTRELNPKIPKAVERKIRSWAEDAFCHLHGTGAPRIDFIGNNKTGEIWLNEVNPCPGSFGFFLWEAASPPILFSELLEALIQEGLQQHQDRRLPKDPTPRDARLFPRRGS